MDLSQYGPFANVVALASALIATFSIILLKVLGRINRWTWLSSGSPPFLVTAAARVLAISLMAITYIIINKSNYKWFGGAAVITGVLGFAAIVWFDRLRKLHVTQIPLTGANGQQLQNRKGKLLFENAVIGLETDLRPEAKAALAETRRTKGGISLRQFMSGYGAQRLNDPEALWDSSLLAKVSNKLTTTLMLVVLFAVMTLFWSAFSIEAANR